MLAIIGYYLLILDLHLCLMIFPGEGGGGGGETTTKSRKKGSYIL